MDNRITLTVKLTVGKDDDLIDWLASLPKGERQSLIKRLLREAVQHRQNDEQCLAQIGQDTAWLRAAFSELPTWMEGLLSRISIVQVANATTVETKLTRTGQLSTENVARREKRIAKARW